jgi:hypothetical protein
MRQCIAALLAAFVIVVTMMPVSSARAGAGNENHDDWLVPAGQYREGFELFAVGRWSSKDESEVSSDLNLPTGTEVEVDPYLGGGVGFGINYGDHFNWNVTAIIGPAEFDANNGVSIDDGYFVSADLNFEYNIFAAPVTPYVGTGIGLFYANGDVQGGRDLDETNLAGNLSAGIRIDFPKFLFVKIGYRMTVTTLDWGDGDAMFLHGAQVAVGARF